MEQKGVIFNIQPFSVYDGPGIRTTVFFKGCSLRCAWCHNPESYSMEPQLQFYPQKCIGCGACATVCPRQAQLFTPEGRRIDRNRCENCGACADQCFSEALSLTGKRVTAKEVFTILMEDAPYFKRSGGGVTFSGGECMLQPMFLKELLILCKAQNIHTAVDTAGTAPWAAFAEILPLTDLFLFDVKAARSETHKGCTGVGNEQILKNLAALSEHGANIIVRIPFIPGANDAEIPEIAALLQPLQISLVELLAYHRLGEGKRAALGLENASFPLPTPEDMEEACRILKSRGLQVKYSR